MLAAEEEQDPQDVAAAARSTRWSLDRRECGHGGQPAAWTATGQLFLENRMAEGCCECLGGGARHLRGSFCAKEDLGLFEALRAEIALGVRPWSGNWRPGNDGKWRTPWRSGMGSEQVEDLEGNLQPAHAFVLRKLASLMNAEVQMWWTNFYEDGSVGCEFHHDGHAAGNVTVGASFGAARDLTFQHAATGREHSFLQENGDVFAFNEKVDNTYMHGVYPIDERVGPRISVILFGRTRTGAQIDPEALESVRRLLQGGAFSQTTGTATRRVGAEEERQAASADEPLESPGCAEAPRQGEDQQAAGPGEPEPVRHPGRAEAAEPVKPAEPEPPVKAREVADAAEAEEGPPAPTPKPRPPIVPADRETVCTAAGAGREAVGTWFTYNGRYIGTFDVREAPTGRLFLEQLLPNGRRLSGGLRKKGGCLEAELQFEDKSPGGSIRLRLQRGQDGPAVLLMRSASWRGEVRAERSDCAYFVDNSTLQADSPGLEYCRSRCLDDPEVPPRFAHWGTTVQGMDQGDGWLRVGSRGEAGRHYLPMALQGVSVLLPRSRLWQCKPINGTPVAIRAVPDLDGPVTGESLKIGEVFEVSCTHKGIDLDVYLKLADGRGWVSSRSSIVGTCCVFHGFGSRPVGRPSAQPLQKPQASEEDAADADEGDARESARRRLERRRLEARARAAAREKEEQDPAVDASALPGPAAGPPPARDWTCTECGFDVPAAERVCSFCDTPRGEGICAIALRS